VIVSFLYFFHVTQAYNLSRDHKPELEAERERIQSAGGYIQMGRVNGTLNLSRAIGILFLLASFCSYFSPYLMSCICKILFTMEYPYIQIPKFLSTLYLGMTNSSVLGFWKNQYTSSISIFLSLGRNMIDRGPKHD